jgi:hypothetical protein
MTLAATGPRWTRASSLPMDPTKLTPALAVRNAHAWFEHNSGWAPPDDDTLAEWLADGVCRCPDECLVAPEGWCEHGLASWWLILDALPPPGG